jgi:hypothetical protein
MRGKLRDKRRETKRDGVKRELAERRRSGKRDNRDAAWQDLQVDQAEEDLLDVNEEMLLENTTK